MRIDAHQHYWDPRAVDYFWMPDDDPVLSRPYVPSDLEPILERNQFAGSVVVQAAHDPREAAWMLDLAARHPSILGVVAWADLTSADLPHVLDGLQQSPKFKGIRHIAQDEPDVNWLLRDDVIAGLRELARRGIPYDILVKPPQLHVVEPLVDKVPGLPVVIDHIAKPYIKDHIFDGWAQQMEAIAKIPHMHVKMSGMITEADHANWTADDLRPYVRHVYATFGPGRILFGSDWPVCLLAGSWKEVLAAFTQTLGALEQEPRLMMLGENAARFYKLDVPAGY
ncbi:MAG: amidohydrolase family protein [Acidobacteria bacterium]|nr:amidohydrolase family protein [Acidobacteriota bacterium]